MEKIKEYLEKLARGECWLDDEDFNPMEFSGGNFDDAYYRGVDDGQTILARELLAKFFKED